MTGTPTNADGRCQPCEYVSAPCWTVGLPCVRLVPVAKRIAEPVPHATPADPSHREGEGTSEALGEFTLEWAIAYARTYWQWGNEPESQAALTVLAQSVESLSAAGLERGAAAWESAHDDFCVVAGQMHCTLHTNPYVPASDVQDGAP